MQKRSRWPRSERRSRSGRPPARHRPLTSDGLFVPCCSVFFLLFLFYTERRNENGATLLTLLLAVPQCQCLNWYESSNKFTRLDWLPSSAASRQRAHQSWEKRQPVDCHLVARLLRLVAAAPEAIVSSIGGGCNCCCWIVIDAKADQVACCHRVATGRVCALQAAACGSTGAFNAPTTSMTWSSLLQGAKNRRHTSGSGYAMSVALPPPLPVVGQKELCV